MKELNKRNFAKAHSNKKSLKKIAVALWLSFGSLSLPATGTILSSSTGVIQGREPDILDVELSLISTNKVYELMGNGAVLACYSPANFEIGVVVNGTDADDDGPIVGTAKDMQINVTNKRTGAALTALQMNMPMGANHYLAVDNPVFNIQANVDITTTSGSPRDMSMGHYSAVREVEIIRPAVKRLSDGTILPSSVFISSANYQEGELFQVLANGVDTKDNDKVLFIPEPAGIQVPDVKITEDGVFQLPISQFDNKAPNGYGVGVQIYITCKGYEQSEFIKMPRALYAYGV